MIDTAPAPVLDPGLDVQAHSTSRAVVVELSVRGRVTDYATRPHDDARCESCTGPLGRSHDSGVSGLCPRCLYGPLP